MKQLLLILIAILTFTCNEQETKQENFMLTVSPGINKGDKLNQAIITALTNFLKTKNNALTENNNWVQADFQEYIYPYFDIYNIEHSKNGDNFYQPTLMEIIPTNNATQKIIKIAFIGYNKETKESQLKAIYNLVANIGEGKILFSRYLNYSTKDWMVITGNKFNLTYKISPNKTVNQKEITAQQEDIEKLCQFFDCSPIPITYYSCADPEEIFEIKGFDYTPMMYVDKTGGLTDYGSIIFSGNNAEVYTHEIVHIYTNKLFPKIDKFIDEGLATFMAGSGKYDYEWHRNKLDKFLHENNNYNFADHTDAYERMYFETETSIPYLASALIVERTLSIYGKEKLMEILQSGTGLWETLKKVGLTKDNINSELRKQIKLPLASSTIKL